MEELIIDLEEIKAYRTLEGQSFDFGNGLIKNDLSFGTEEAYWEMEQQDIESIIDDYYEYPVNYFKIKKNKHRLNRYERKNITKRKLEKLNKLNWWSVYYSENKQRFVRCYLSGRRGYAKWCSKRAVRNNKEFSTRKSNSYRKVFDYWWTIF